MNKLSQYLFHNKIRQTDFAKDCGVTQPVISRLVHEIAQPSPELAKKIELNTRGSVRFYDWPAYAAFSPQQAVSGGE